VDGFARFRELIASYWDEDSEPDPARVVVVIETDRGPWVKALAAAGYRVYPANPKQAARHKETVAVSGKKDDFFDAACLADMGRTRRHQMRELAADSDTAEAVKIAARAHQKLVWERTRQLLRMRSALREYFPAALEAYAALSQPGIGDITGARILGEFGDAPGRYASAKARKNYAGTSPLTIESGKKRTVHARYIRNRHLIDALHAQALSALTASRGARAYYDELRAHDAGHDDALRRVASRLAGILHGCVKTGCEYDETTAWSHRAESPQAA